MTAEIVKFLPRARNRPDSDFPTIVFKGPIAPANAHERELYWKAQLEANALIPSIFEAPEKDPA